MLVQDVVPGLWKVPTTHMHDFYKTTPVVIDLGALYSLDCLAATRKCVTLQSVMTYVPHERLLFCMPGGLSLPLPSVEDLGLIGVQ